MNHLSEIKRFFIFIFLFPVACLSFAQAKLNVNGAKLNMGTGIFISTNDVSVSGTTLTVSAATLKVANSITSSNAIDISNGTLDMNGAAPQQIPANSLTGNVIKNLTVSGSDDVTLEGQLDLTDALTVSGAGSLTSDGYLTFKSTSTKTARFAPVTTSATIPVNGNVIIERYITSKRAFRFLTAPVNSPGDIRANWMENTNNPNTSVNNNPVPGFGTHITGLAGGTNGFDATATNNPSLFTYNNQTQAWAATITTSGHFSPGNAYRILVRGDRSTNTNLAAPPSSITTLRATGTLAARTFIMAKPGGGGTSGMPELSASSTGYSFIGNPYASPVDWDLLEKNDLSSSIYIWDPTINGTNGRGAYVNFNSGTGVSNIASMVDNNIQSGQAFFVRNTGSAPSLTFKEIYKTSTHRAVFRTENLPRLSLQLLLPGQDTSGGAADGLCAYFADHFDSSITDQDSYKFTNLDENIAIVRNGSSLSIEARKPPVVRDTLPLKVWQLLQKTYSFKSIITNFQTATYLEDSYLSTSTKLNNNDTTIIPFSITADSSSFANNRFRIVFKPYSITPVTVTVIKAYEKLPGVQVDWKTQSDGDIKKYEIQKSPGTQQFVRLGSVKVKLSRGASAEYDWFDENPFNGDNYYRIKSFSKSGEVKYSAVVKVLIAAKAEDATVSATAEEGNSINVQLKNVKAGNYALSLMNTAGQKLYSGSLVHPGGSASTKIKMNNLLTGGIYHLQLFIGNRGYNASVIIP